MQSGSLDICEVMRQCPEMVAPSWLAPLAPQALVLPMAMHLLDTYLCVCPQGGSLGLSDTVYAMTGATLPLPGRKHSSQFLRTAESTWAALPSSLQHMPAAYSVTQRQVKVVMQCRQHCSSACHLCGVLRWRGSCHTGCSLGRCAVAHCRCTLHFIWSPSCGQCGICSCFQASWPQYIHAMSHADDPKAVVQTSSYSSC